MDLQRFLFYPIEQLPYVLFALLLAFTVHEFAHAYVAFKFGDPTAKRQGRVTLNPLAHLDPLGTIMVFLLGFGWARPVPVNRFHFRNPRLAGVLVSAAGPISNLLIAFIFVFLAFLFNQASWFTNSKEISYLFTITIQLNIVLFAFNLLPFPPLDGYRIIEDLVPNRTRAVLTQYEQYGIFIFLFLAITPLGNYVFGPLFQIIVPIIRNGIISVVSAFFNLF